MSKITIANYLINDLSKRFPFEQSGIIDHDVIDIMIQNWDNHCYPTFNFNPNIPRHPSDYKHILM